MTTFDRIENAVKELMGDKCRVYFEKMEKNNGKQCRAITIHEPKMVIAWSIDIDELLEDIAWGESSIEEVTLWIVNAYKIWDDLEKFKDISSLSKEAILEKVKYYFINKERNPDLLEDAPYKEVLDLTAVYKGILRKGESEGISIVINRTVCERYSISEEELDAVAKKNTMDEGICGEPVLSFLGRRLGIPEGIDIPGMIPMWVITNPSDFYGATVMLYKDFFKDFADELESDLYILPASVHEVIAVPADKTELEQLRKTVYEVNEEEIPAEEVLSDSVYRYSRNRGELFIV